MTWAAEHVVGVARGVSEDIMADLRANFNGECTEVGMYLSNVCCAFISSSSRQSSCISVTALQFDLIKNL